MPRRCQEERIRDITDESEACIRPAQAQGQTSCSSGREGSIQRFTYFAGPAGMVHARCKRPKSPALLLDLTRLAQGDAASRIQLQDPGPTQLYELSVMLESL